MICTSEYKQTYNALVDAVRGKKISKKRLNQSVKRILIMKYKRGIVK